MAIAIRPSLTASTSGRLAVLCVLAFALQIRAWAPAAATSFEDLQASNLGQALLEDDAAPGNGGGNADNGPWVPLKVAANVGASGAGGPQASLGAVPDGSGGFVLVPLTGESGGSGEAANAPLAWGSFADTLSELGWCSLSMHVSSDTARGGDGAKMYAAGVVEGYLTANRMREFKHNSRALFEMNPDSRQKLPQLERGLADVISKLSGPAGSFDVGESNPFDAQSRLTVLQARGVRDGFVLALGGSEPLSMTDMFILNSDGVIDELLSKYGSGNDVLLQRGAAHQKLALRGANSGKGNAMTPLARKRHKRRPTGHCTGLARLSQDKSELFLGHTTWEGFSEMTRVWKVYDFPLQGVTAKKISFSSYPGCVSSTDDYYLMDNGLAITETTLSIPTEQRYPPAGTVPDFVRIMASNRLATTAEDWVQQMVDSATGTYSSQWLVVDYKQFSPGNDLQKGTFLVLEQAPGVSHYEDMSEWLQQKGYWASFDRAFFDEVRARTGDAEREEESKESSSVAQAEIYSKDQTPRAQIARMTANDTNSLAAMRSEMTRNRGVDEPVDQPDLRIPRYAISARDDLKDGEHNDPDGSPDGGVDAKVTSSCLFRSLTAEAISGPSHATLPPFRWTSPEGAELWAGYPHEGLPDVADFGWMRVGPAEGNGNSVASAEAPVVSQLAEGVGSCQ